MPLGEVERLRFGLEEIHFHFDDQDFGPHEEKDCAGVLVNYAGAILGGFEGTLAEYWADRKRREATS